MDLHGGRATHPTSEAKGNELLDGIEEVMGRARAIDAQQYLLAGNAEELHNKLVVPVSTLLADAIFLMKSLAEELDSNAATSAWSDGAISNPNEIDGILLETNIARLQDLCLVGQMEMGQALRRLERITLAEREEQLDACDCTRRKLLQISSRILHAAAIFRSGPPVELEDNWELDNAIAVRRAYSRLRRVFGSQVPTELSSMRRLHRDVASTITQILADTTLIDIRVQDRALFLSLHYRLMDWLRSEGNLSGGEELHQDLNATIELTQSINDRDVLREHDREHLARARRELLHGSRDEEHTRELTLQLHSLEGYHANLDEILEQARAGESLSSVRVSLERFVSTHCNSPIGSGASPHPASTRKPA